MRQVKADGPEFVDVIPGSLLLQASHGLSGHHLLIPHRIPQAHRRARDGWETYADPFAFCPADIHRAALTLAGFAGFQVIKDQDDVLTRRNRRSRCHCVSRQTGCIQPDEPNSQLHGLIMITPRPVGRGVQFSENQCEKLPASRRRAAVCQSCAGRPETLVSRAVR